MRFAVDQIGKPYVWGAEGPDSYDCSGLTQRAWGSAGTEVPRTSQEQWAELDRVPLRELRPGDLVVYFPKATHVALYLGDGLVVHAPAPAPTSRSPLSPPTRSSARSAPTRTAPRSRSTNRPRSRKGRATGRTRGTRRRRHRRAEASRAGSPTMTPWTSPPCSPQPPCWSPRRTPRRTT
ncbi:C40 family peptidase [Actinomadura keratinilytica]